MQNGYQLACFGMVARHARTWMDRGCEVSHDFAASGVHAAAESGRPIHGLGFRIWRINRSCNVENVDEDTGHSERCDSHDSAIPQWWCEIARPLEGVLYYQ